MIYIALFWIAALIIAWSIMNRRAENPQAPVAQCTPSRNWIITHTDYPTRSKLRWRGLQESLQEKETSPPPRLDEEERR